MFAKKNNVMTNEITVRKKKLFDLSTPAIERFNEEAKSQRLFCKTYIELLLEKIAKQKKLPKV